MPTADVVIVGGGIGGAALGRALAEAGLGVTVLEATETYRDRVRGESMQAWGVAEARALGAESALMDAGAHVAPLWKTYDAEGNEGLEVPMAFMVPGVDGSLNLRHPDACQALADAAAAAGAAVVRGVGDVVLEPGSSPTVTYTADGSSEEITTGLVVGADGRASTVRRQVGIELEKQEAISFIAGLLVAGLEVDQSVDQLVSDHETYSLIFHQREGRARVYLCGGRSDQQRFTGPTASEAFQEACRRSGHASVVACGNAATAGPCASYPGDDTWTDEPYVDGVVLIGDAAGHNDPIIGQGLAIAMRDARTVRDLVLDGARTAQAFAPYGAERSERMARLRLVADILAVVQAEDADNRPARRDAFATAAVDPETGLLTLMLAAFAGPESVPEELVDPTWVDRLRAA